MSIEAIKLAAEFNRYFTSANGVDVPAKVSVSRDEWRALFTAIQQAEAQQPATGEPVWCVATGERVNGEETYTHHDAYVPLADCFPLYTHPAPSVPADVVRDAERYRFIRDADISDDLIPDVALYALESLDGYIDAAMLAAK